MTLKSHFKRHWARSVIFFLSFLFFIASGTGCGVVPLTSASTHDWIAENLQRIQVDDPDHFSFAVFGDNRGSYEIFPRLLRQVNQDPEIHFAMDLGDLVPVGKMERHRTFISQVQKDLKCPLLTAVGNHELYGGGRGVYHDLYGPFYYSFQIGRSYFIVLDDANGKGLDQPQEKWLEMELKKAQSCNNRFVFMHVPLFDPRGGIYQHCLPKKAGLFLSKIFERYRVTHIFASHIHGYFSGQWGGTPYTITGGAGAPVYGRDTRHYFYHFVRVRVDNKNIKIAIRRITSADQK
jgi:hypothetical protein